jgi:hypothetical protein
MIVPRDDDYDAVDFDPFDGPTISGKVPKTGARLVMGNPSDMPKSGPQVPRCEALTSMGREQEPVLGGAGIGSSWHGE